jgi:hypothetical protein
MWCDHPGTKAVTFLINHVNRASQRRADRSRRAGKQGAVLRPWKL